MSRLFATGFLVTSLLITPLLAREHSAGILRFPETPEIDALVALLAKQLQTAGYRTETLDARDLSRPERLNRDRVDLLLIPQAGRLPAAAIPAVEAFLRAGGDLIALQAPLWREPLIQIGGEWTTREAYVLAHAKDRTDHILFPALVMTGWQRNSNHDEIETVCKPIKDAPGLGGPALQVTLADLQGWDIWMSPQWQNPFPPGHTLTVFSARGSGQTDQLAVEWREKDESRWIATVPLRTEWQWVVLQPADFKPWTGGMPGGAGRPFNPENAMKLSFGLAFSHTGAVRGSHEYWIGPIGTSAVTPDYSRLLQVSSVPALDTLAPQYKIFESHGVASLSSPSRLWSETLFSLPASPTLFCPHPRAQGHGFNKGRQWRWIPLIEARDRAGEWRGTPATLTLHSDGPHKGGFWASFGVRDSSWYASPEVLRLIGQVAGRMRDGAFILDGGANYYTYFEGQELTLGLTAVNANKQARSGLTARIIAKNTETSAVEFQQDWPVVIGPDEARAVSRQWKPKKWPPGGLRVVAELRDGDRVLDRVEHDVHVWQPQTEKHFITGSKGQFQLDGQRWRAHGVNYMPSSGIATEDGAYFADWLGARSYDPEVIQRDLDHIKALGMNSVSIFINHPAIRAQNLLDFLRRLDVMGMKANLSLRPADPMHFEWAPVREIIDYCHLAEFDTLFAYDLAWEPMFRGHDERIVWDTEWEAWIREIYGSIEAAEKDWGFAVPRNETGKITNPSTAQIDSDGSWRKMVAAYRRFLDVLLYQRHAAARSLVRTIDAHHLVSFRMTEAGDPTFRSSGWIAYDFPYLALGVDMLAPEAYGRIGGWEQVKPALFEVAYGRWAAPDKPLIWAEAGVSAWDAAREVSGEKQLQAQAEYYRQLYRMLIESGSDGIFFWWYPGGFRTGEVSDFGIINPDGSDRPVTQVIRQHARRFLEAPNLAKPDTWIEIDRDESADGLAGIYDRAKAAYWSALQAGHVVGLRTAGTGTTSKNCPLVAVGNSPCNGLNPPKFLDASFDRVEIRMGEGKWEAVAKRVRLEIPRGQRVQLRIEVTNLGEASWIAPTDPAAHKDGDVCLRVMSNDKEQTLPIPRPTARGQSVEIETIELTSPSTVPVKVELRMFAAGRTPFGERFTFELAPH